MFATIKASVALVHPYKERLNPWALVRLLPNMQRVIVGQFRNRSDADGHLEILRRLIPYSLLPTPYSLLPTPYFQDRHHGGESRHQG